MTKQNETKSTDKLTDFQKCTIHTRIGDRGQIECCLGLWSVEGPWGPFLINEATRYFYQYKNDGEYDELLKD